MDDPSLDVAAHRQALAGLARINRISKSAGVLWPNLRSLAAELKRPLRILDIATGSGDVPLVLAKNAEREGVALEMHGLDISPVAVAEAWVRAELEKRLNLSFQVFDVLGQPLPGGYDALICSLFLHHLDEADVVK